MLRGKGILSDFQKEFLSLFAGLPDQDQFYLTGGTALAEYYLGHRLSYDLDLFTGEASLVLPFSHQIEQAVEKTGARARVVRRFASFVEFEISAGVNRLKVDLALESLYRLAPVEPGDAGVMVNNFQDIQADKTLAFFGRAEPRDAIDLFFLLKATPIERLMEGAKAKDSGFDPYWFAVALNRVSKYPDDITRWPVQMLAPCDPIELKRLFQTMALQLMPKLK
jgi:hypothetical protein